MGAERPAVQQELARRFHRLHHGEGPLVLANVWDPGSAVLVADAGAAAIATTSAGVAWALGAADGGGLSRDQVVELTARVVAAVDLPVTADLEEGFGATAAEVGRTVELVLAAGVAGINIEDGREGGALRPVEEQVARIAAARAAADAAGVELFVNARTDVYLRRVGEPEERLEHALARGKAYAAAGADGIFVPMASDVEDIAALAAGLPLPLNVLVGEGWPTVAELGALGVARVSLGPGLSRAAYGAARRLVEEVLGSGSYRALEGAPSTQVFNGLFG
ncbi:isocitrate lyase/phosphoenolpyruvate mutase family protein [Kitasatospora sp. NPDC052896]|uniref:isocitrate lyase/phosphoenolpyruvate mutase family protein n=1 Tax=Kitasatospora sp. NPDC052896 TaxID=3364061 RepID=UPI0037C5AA80